MRKIKMTMIAALAAITLAGCGSAGKSMLGGMTTGASAGATTSTASQANGEEGGLASLLGNVLGTVLGSSKTLSQEDLIGTWNFQGTDCVFESENLLMKAGGEVAASKVESKLDETLAKFGIAVGKCTIKFNSDNTYVATISGRSLSGQYTLDAANKKITMTYLAGLATMTPNIVKSGNSISLLYEADKLLAIAQKLSAMSGNATMQTLASLASSYDGMLIGLELKK